MKFEEIHQNRAVLRLHGESRDLGPQRTGGRQRVKTTIGRVGWRLNRYEWSSFAKLKGIYQNLAILPLHKDSKALGPHRAGGRQRVNLGLW